MFGLILGFFQYFQVLKSSDSFGVKNIQELWFQMVDSLMDIPNINLA